MIVPVSFTSTSSALAKVRTDLIAQGFTGSVYLGKQFLKQHRDPTSGGSIVGTVVAVPLGRGTMSAARLTGGNPRPMYTVARPLALHCWSTAPIGSFASQYEADLTAAEILTASVLRSFEVLIPGAKRAGDQEVTDAGENSFGVELVTNITIDLEVTDVTYQVATGAVWAPNYGMQFPLGNVDSGSDQF